MSDIVLLAEVVVQRDRLLATVEKVTDLAREWFYQSTDYDEDTEQQIADGKTLLELLGVLDAEADK